MRVSGGTGFANAVLPEETMCTAQPTELSGKRLLLVVPSATSFETFFPGVTARWVKLGGLAAVATGPELPGRLTTPWPAGVKRFRLRDFRCGRPGPMLAASAQLHRIIREWTPEIVHAHFAVAVLASACARLSMPWADVHWLATYQGLHAGAEGTSCRARWAELMAARLMSQNWVLTRHDAEILSLAIGPATVRHQRSLGVGCDLARFDPVRYSGQGRRSLRESLAIPPDKAVLLYIGRKAAFKGFASAVRCLWATRQLGHDAHLIVVGTNDSLHSSGLSAEEQNRYMHDCHITDAGWQDDVAPYLAIADLTVIPSIREGMSVAMMESLAMGVPVVTSDRRGCGDVVRNGIDGVTLASVQPASVAEAVSALLVDRARLAGMTAEAIRGRSRFDRKNYINEQVEIYARLFGDNRRAYSRESVGDP